MADLELKIRARFDEISDKDWFSTDIEPTHFEAVEILGWFPDPKKRRILDAGCARGRFKKILAKREALCTGIDINYTFIKDAKRNVFQSNFAVASLSNIPFFDDTSDGVFCIEVLEHITDTEEAIRELVRVLKPGGKILIIDKNILSLHPRYLIPTFMYKRIQEYRNKWMYPHGFPFRERYFLASKIQALMKKYCTKTEVRFLRGRGERYSRLIYKASPFLSFDVAWRGIK